VFHIYVIIVIVVVVVVIIIIIIIIIIIPAHLKCKSVPVHAMKAFRLRGWHHSLVALPQERTPVPIE